MDSFWIYMKITSLFTLREFLSLEIGHRLIQSREQDTFLVSFPRSGNTWMRTMLGVLIDPSEEGNPDFTRQMIPGVSISNSKKIRNLELPRLIKSHTWYRKSIPRAIYLVRDVRDVLVSLYHYYTTRQGKDIPFPQFIDGYHAGMYGQLWHQNVESWLIQGQEDLQTNLLVIRFEDLKSNTSQVLNKTAQYLKIPVDDTTISKAVEVANLVKMRRIEEQRRGPVSNEDASFYRGGKTGQWKEYFTPDIKRVVERRANLALKAARYI